MVPVPYDLVIVNFGRLQVIRYGQFHRCRIETLAGLIICLLIEEYSAEESQKLMMERF